MQLKHVTVTALASLEAQRVARGPHDVHVEDGNEGKPYVVWSRNTEYLGWQTTAEGVPYVDFGTAMGIVLSVATFDYAVAALVFDAYTISITACRRIWGCLEQAGLEPPKAGANLGALLKSMADAARNVEDPSLLRVGVADLYQTEPKEWQDEDGAPE
jgi:hypothetical protein